MSGWFFFIRQGGPPPRPPPCKRDLCPILALHRCSSSHVEDLPLDTLPRQQIGCDDLPIALCAQEAQEEPFRKGPGIGSISAGVEGIQQLNDFLLTHSCPSAFHGDCLSWHDSHRAPIRYRQYTHCSHSALGGLAR